MSQNPKKEKGQVIYFSHGGGPLPLLDDPSHRKMIDFMTDLPRRIHRPEAIVVFSAHWEENTVTVQNGPAPDMVYDYYGFPEAAYSIKYPAKGAPDLAEKVVALLKENGIECRLDDKRPYDHGSYIPLKMMYPLADVPVIQVSLHHNLDPETHLCMGKALQPLLEENILIIGSGFSFHNMSRFDFSGGNQEDALNDVFQNQLIEVCCGNETEEQVWEQFVNWDRMPGARYCHPREEHLLPLLVCVGMSQGAGETVFDDYILGKRGIAFLWKTPSFTTD